MKYVWSYGLVAGIISACLCVGAFGEGDHETTGGWRPRELVRGEKSWRRKIVETSSKVKFERDEHKGRLGWKDPEGRLWLDAPKDRFGNFVSMSREEAIQYCKNLSAGLPTNADLEELVGYLSDNKYDPETYDPRIIVGLTSEGSERGDPRPRGRANLIYAREGDKVLRGNKGHLLPVGEYFPYAKAVGLCVVNKRED